MTGDEIKVKTDFPERTTIRWVLLPALFPAACYLLLKPSPLAPAVGAAAFIATPVVTGGLLGWRGADLPTGPLLARAASYALAGVFVFELAHAALPIAVSNLINLPLQWVLAALLFSLSGLMARFIRSARARGRGHS